MKPWKRMLSPADAHTHATTRLEPQHCPSNPVDLERVFGAFAMDGERRRIPCRLTVSHLCSLSHSQDGAHGCSSAPPHASHGRPGCESRPYLGPHYPSQQQLAVAAELLHPSQSTPSSKHTREARLSGPLLHHGLRGRGVRSLPSMRRTFSGKSSPIPPLDIGAISLHVAYILYVLRTCCCRSMEQPF